MFYNIHTKVNISRTRHRIATAYVCVEMYKTTLSSKSNPLRTKNNDLQSYNPDHIIVEFVFYPLLETRLQLSGAMHNLLHFNFFS